MSFMFDRRVCDKIIASKILDGKEKIPVFAVTRKYPASVAHPVVRPIKSEAGMKCLFNFSGGAEYIKKISCNNNMKKITLKFIVKSPSDNKIKKTNNIFFHFSKAITSKAKGRC